LGILLSRDVPPNRVEMPSISFEKDAHSAALHSHLLSCAFSGAQRPENMPWKSRKRTSRDIIDKSNSARPRIGGLSFAHRPVLSAMRATRTQGSSWLLTCQPTPSGPLAGCAMLSPLINWRSTCRRYLINKI
jgi:hypothetical protein